jgi:sugar O-acyltransferase (sialic acid O-acetyltransferase NeuD family)
LKNLYLVGGGGHCRSCIDVIEQEGVYKIQGIFDKVIPAGTSVLGYKVIGTDEEMASYIGSQNYFLVSVGQIKSTEARVKLFDSLKKQKANFATVISPRAYVSKHAKISAGTIVMHDAVVNAQAEVGDNCILNTKALVEHDAKIGSHCHISTASVVNGGCILGERCFVGSNAVLKEYIQIPEQVIVPAGSFYRG